MAPTESSTTMRDVPAPAPTPAPEPPKSTREKKHTPPPPARPPAPPQPTSFTAGAGTAVGATIDDSITTRSAKAGDPFTATVSEAVRDPSGHVVIPAGSVISGTIVRADPAPNPRSSGSLELSVTTVSINGRRYQLDATVGSKDTVMQGRGVTGADAAKVGAGAAAGAVVGKIFGKNTKGAVIGGVLGAAGGAVAAQRSRDIDVVLPKGGAMHITLNQPLTVAAH
ncbi:MAG TPA: glycine zipper 2TM domain-containing protein [Gemmatimonadales bacterium]|nr:glycine zipper 2TM domain-containing protein [Gemmatimonadales bacterium]